MALPYHQFSFGDALLAAASMVREDRLRREQMALQERQFQRDLALRQQALEQDERQAVRTDRTVRRGQSIQRDLGFAGIATTRRGQDLTFESGERDRRQRSAFHQDNMDLAREQMLNAREVARISSGGSGARDLLLRIQAYAALDQMGFEANPSDLGLDFDLPRATGFTPPPSPLPYTATAGELANPMRAPWTPGTYFGADRTYWFRPGGAERQRIAEKYVQEGLGQYRRDLESRGRLSQIEAQLYVSQLENELTAARENPNLKNNPQALSEIVASIQALKGLALSKVRGASR